MKKFILNLLLLFSLLFSNQIIGQVPQGVNYQAAIADNSGFPLANTSVGVKFIIISNGGDIYEEEHFPSTNNIGRISVIIGEGTTLSGNFSAINWASDTYSISVYLDSGSGYVLFGTSPLSSVFYALQAQNALVSDSVAGVDLSNLSGGGSDDQNLTNATLDGTTLTIDIENGSSVSVDLSDLQSGNNTDNQTLDWDSTNNTLSIDGGNAVILPINEGGVGPQGEPGINGQDGADGIDGQDGEQGPQGIQGPQGDPATDDQTLSWDSSNYTLSIDGGNSVVLPISGGSVGPQGPQGEPGVDGQEGEQGIQGEQGLQGEPGEDNQVLSISNDTIYLEDGGFVVLPEGIEFSGDFNDLTNIPQEILDGDSDNQELSIDNNLLSISEGNTIELPTFEEDTTNEIQALSISNDTIFLENGGFVVLPNEEDEDSDSTNEIQNLAQVLEEGNDAGQQSMVNIEHLTVGDASNTQSVALEVNSTNSAFLPPRMSNIQMRTLVNPIDGMMVFNTNEKCLFFYSQGHWNSTCGVPTATEMLVEEVISASGSGESEVIALDKDADGNVYIMGAYSSQLTIDGTTITNDGTSRTFIGKFTSDGQLIWLESTNYQPLQKMVVYDGYIYMAKTDLIVKYDIDGNYTWFKFLNSNSVLGSKVVMNVHTFGITLAGSSVVSLVENSIKIVHFDRNGNFQWSRQSSSGNLVVRDITHDNFGLIYLTGILRGVVTFGSTEIDPVDYGGVINKNFGLKMKVNAISGGAILDIELEEPANNGMFSSIIGNTFGPDLTVLGKADEFGSTSSSRLYFGFNDSWLPGKYWAGTGNVLHADLDLNNTSNLNLYGTIEEGAGFELKEPSNNASGYAARTSGYFIANMSYSISNNKKWLDNSTLNVFPFDSNIKGIATIDENNVAFGGYFQDTITFGDTTLTTDSPTNKKMYIVFLKN